MSITLSALQQQRRDTAANWTAENPTLLAGEIGIESDTGKIKIGTGAAAWTSLAYQGIIPSSGAYPLSQLIMPLGTAAAPAVTFTGDVNTGLYSSGADQVSFSTGGTERLRIDATGQIEAVSLGTAAAPTYTFTGDPNTGIYSPGADQLAISTGGSGRLFVDSTGNLHLGYSSNFGADGFNIINSSGGGISIARDNSGTSTSGTVLGSLSFQSYLNGQGSSTAEARISAIAAETQSGSTAATSLAFYTKPTGQGPGASISSYERLRITSAGLVGIGTGASTPNGTLETKATAGVAPFVASGPSSEYARVDSSGRLLVGTSSDSGGALLQVNGDRIRVGTAKTPASATATGTAGEICWDASYVYVCTATNTWKRSALSTW